MFYLFQTISIRPFGRYTKKKGLIYVHHLFLWSEIILKWEKNQSHSSVHIFLCNVWFCSREANNFVGFFFLIATTGFIFALISVSFVAFCFSHLPERNHKVDICSNRFTFDVFCFFVCATVYCVISVGGLNVSPNENMHKVMPNFRSFSFVVFVSGSKTLLSQNIHI